MIRPAASAAGSATVVLAALFAVPGVAAAEPADTTYAIAKCFDGTQAPEQRPARFAYNCDETGVMQDMAWTQWDADGAKGAGYDNAIECQPNCAQGTRLINPIVVHAWNPSTPKAPGCPPGAQFYTDLTIAYPDAAPPWIDPGTTWDEGTDFVTIDGMPAVHFSGLTPRCS
ncbi:MAG: hypothetical protein ABW137_22355 [Mycobacterium sp.]